MKEKFYCRLFSGVVYDGFARNIEKRDGLMILEFQPVFAVRCYSKFRKAIISLASIKRSSHHFVWNSTCPICGFKAKNQKGLRIHTTKKHKAQKSKPTTSTEKTNTTGYKPISTHLVKVLNKNRKAPKKTPISITITPKSKPLGIREQYRIRMENYTKRISERLR